MRPVIEDMCNLLAEQKELLEEILTLSYEKRRFIISGNVESLEETVRQEVRKLSKLKATEKKRMALTPAIGDMLGLSEQDITISAIAKHAEPDERQRLEALQLDLTGLLQRQTAINNENQELIKTHMEYTDTMIELMSDSEDPLNNYYSGDGRTADTKKTKSFYSGKA